MKKIILFILLFCATKSFAQFPINAATGTPTTTVLTRGISAADSGYWYRTAFADTTALNRGRIDEIAGVVARTSDNSLWLRNNTATGWIQLSGGSGSVNIYNSNGSLTGDRVLSGTNLYNLRFDAVTSFRAEANASTGKVSSMNISPDSVLFQPNEGIFIIDSLASGASTDSVLVWTQATGRVKKRAYSAFTPTWQQTLTAGSQFSVNNSVDLNGKTLTFLDNSTSFNRLAINNSASTLYSPTEQGVLGLGESTSSLQAKDTLNLINAGGNIRLRVLTNLSTQDRLIGQTASSGQLGYITLGSGLSLSSGVLNTSGTVPTPISSLTAATGTNDINNGAFTQDWRWNSITGEALNLNTNATTSTNNSTLLQVNRSGANASSSIITKGIQITNTHTGTSSTNIGLLSSVSGGTNNYAIIVPASGGDVGIGTSTPTSKLHVVSTQTTGVGNQFSSSTTTTGTILDITGTSTALAAGNEGLNIGISGANATNGITATGARISVTNTNATSGTNVGLDLTASGATTANNALNIAAGAIALNGSAGTSGQVLTSAGASGLPTWTTPTTGTVTGSGTTGYLSKWTGASALGNSVVYDNGTNVGMGNASPVSELQVTSARTSSNTDFQGTGTLIEVNNTAGVGSQANIGVKSESTSRLVLLTTNASNGGEYHFFADKTIPGFGIWGDPAGGASGKYRQAFLNDGSAWFGNASSVGAVSGGDISFMPNRNFGIGTVSPSALLHVISTTEQLRVGYDASNYYSTTVGSTGGVTFNAVGSGSAFTFSDIVNLTSAGLDRTITAAGTTGNQTINKMAGTVNIAAAGTTVTVTNSLVTTSSIIFCTLRTNDATATIKNVVPGSGSFVITLGAAATAEVSIGFLVTN